ncbi:MAG: NAD(+)/NADH kinase [Planctomycetota bacterium]
MADRPSAAPIPRAALIYDGSRPVLGERARALRPIVEKHVEIVTVQDDLSGGFDPAGAELVVAMGGDGTILRAARLMRYAQLPVVAVNLGRLGFLADTPPDRLDESLAEIVRGERRIVDHLMFECTLVRGGGSSGGGECRLGLNEVAVLAGDPFQMIDVQLYVDGDLATTYGCDGMIVSTPVGSTAHNLSVGGPILRKDLAAFVISAINPHTLTVRPVVDTADRVFEVVVIDPNPGTRLLVDGQVVGSIERGDRVRVERSEAVFQLIETTPGGYYGTLREKLGWGRRPRDQKP